MKIIDNEALRFHTPQETAHIILSNVEKSASIATHGNYQELLVYWGFDETSAVAEIWDPLAASPPPPSPMLREYNWPGVFKPFSHQKNTASFLSLRYRAFCFNQAGTGKTPAAIWAADYLMNIGKVKRVLVICPLSIMYSAWQADIFNTAMCRTVAIASGSAERRAKVINNNYEFVIINFDGVNIVEKEIAAAKFDLIIVDEANAYKNTSTRRWKTLARLIRSTTRLWMMTGTPASQSPLDAFGLAKLISPARIPRYSTAWRDKVMYQVSRFKWVPKTSAKKDVHYALQPAIRYTKDECLDLPEVMFQKRDVPLTTQVAIYYKRIKTEFLIEAAGEQVSAINAAAKLSKLLQISGGAVYSDDKNVIEFDISPRLNALKEVLDETENKVVVFVTFRHTIEVVNKFLNAEKYTTDVIHGDVSAKKRANIINQFQTQDNPKVLIIQPQAAAHGITLTAADTVVFWSPVTSVEMYIQCIGRIDRVGQKNKMTVVHLQGSDVERELYKILGSKVDSHNKIVELYNNTIQSPETV